MAVAAQNKCRGAINPFTPHALTGKQIAGRQHMAGIVLSGLTVPKIFPTDEIAIKNPWVFFMNFEVGSAKPTRAHRDFIPFVVAFFIKQIDALGYRDKTLTVHLYGEASATGTPTKNQQLGRDRAQAVGQLLIAEFERKKGTSRLASGVTMTLDLRSDSDDRARQDRNSRLKGLRLDSNVEKMQTSFRNVHFGLEVGHVAVDEDKDYDCRMVYNAKLETRKVPANELERVLDDMENKIGSLAMFFVAFDFAQIKNFAIKAAKKAVEPLLEDFPEVAIVYEAIDFIIPSDIFLCFQFRDHKGAIAQYQYTGQQNKKSFEMFATVTQAISLLKWLTKIGEALDKVGQAQPAVDQARRVLKNGLDSLLGKDGLIRRNFGDGFTDQLVSIMDAGGGGPLVIEASGWFPVTFKNRSVYDPHTFGGSARTETDELLGKADVTLDFLLEGSDICHDYRATTIIHGGFSLQTGILGFGISKGLLRIMP